MFTNVTRAPAGPLSQDICDIVGTQEHNSFSCLVWTNLLPDPGSQKKALAKDFPIGVCPILVFEGNSVDVLSGNVENWCDALLCCWWGFIQQLAGRS